MKNVSEQRTLAMYECLTDHAKFLNLIPIHQAILKPYPNKSRQDSDKVSLKEWILDTLYWNPFITSICKINRKLQLCNFALKPLFFKQNIWLCFRLKSNNGNWCVLIWILFLFCYTRKDVSTISLKSMVYLEPVILFRISWSFYESDFTFQMNLLGLMFFFSAFHFEFN